MSVYGAATAGTGPRLGPNMPSLDIWNPNRAAVDNEAAYSNARGPAATPAGVGDRTFWVQYFPFMLIVVGILYLLEKRRIRVAVGAAAG